MKPTNQFRNPPAISEDNLWSTPDVANFLRCSERQVFTLRQQGLPCLQVGGLIRFEPRRVRDWLSGVDESQRGDERARMLADVAATGGDDNAEVCLDELERRSFDHREIRLPFEGKLTWSLVGRIPAGSHVISLTCHDDGSSVFTGQVGSPDERYRLWAAIREAVADQRNCLVTMDGRVAGIMARPFPTDPAAREEDMKLRMAALAGVPRPGTGDSSEAI